jgi:general secretion pathway protein G
VVVLIGIVTALVVPRVWTRTARARRAHARADLQEIAQALERYRLDAGRYPTAAEGLAALAAPAVPGRRRAGGYLPTVPRDPWGTAYVYAPQGSTYVLRSLGADHAPGGDGDDADLDARQG